MHKTGAVYIAVLMASLLVGSLTMAAVHSARYYARSLNDAADYNRCQLSADAALEWAIARINADPNWRTSHVNNVDIPPRIFNGVNICYRLIDSDNNLKDNAHESCDLLVTASTTNANCSWRSTLIGAGAALKCVNYAVATEDDFKVKSQSVFSTDGNVASFKKVDVNSGGNFTGNTYTNDGSAGAIYGTTNSLGGSLEIPAWEDLSYYTDYGTVISASLLPVFLGDLQFTGQLLSQNSNTISGTLDPLGIYVIDCKGDDIIIANSRLQCTLVLVNVGGNSAITDSVYWEAAQPNYPALLVRGKMDLRLSNSPLRESVAGRNLNPAETPYRGQSDGSSNSVYPSLIRGLIYASEDLSVKSLSAKNQVMGCIVCRKKLEVEGTLAVHARSIFALDPPPGFANFDQVRIAKGSIRRVAAP